MSPLWCFPCLIHPSEYSIIVGLETTQVCFNQIQFNY